MLNITAYKGTNSSSICSLTASSLTASFSIGGLVASSLTASSSIGSLAAFFPMFQNWHEVDSVIQRLKSDSSLNAKTKPSFESVNNVAPSKINAKFRIQRNLLHPKETRYKNENIYRRAPGRTSRLNWSYHPDPIRKSEFSDTEHINEFSGKNRLWFFQICAKVEFNSKSVKFPVQNLFGYLEL